MWWAGPDSDRRPSARQAPGETVDVCLLKFREFLKVDLRRSEKTAYEHTYYAKKFLIAVNTPIESISSEKVREYLKSLKVSSAQYKNILMAYAFEKGEFSYTSLLNDFVNAGKCAKGTLLHYKNDLEDNGSLKKKIDQVTGRPVYFIPAAIRKKMEAKNIFNKIGESAKGAELENVVAILQKDVERLNYREKFHSSFLDYFDGHRMLRSYMEIRAKNPHVRIHSDETLEDYIAKLEKLEAEGAVFEETLVDAWKKGWVNDNERFIWTVHYKDFVNVLVRFKNSITELKNNWYVEERTNGNKELETKEVQCAYCDELIPITSCFCPRCGKIRKEKALWENELWKAQT